MDKGRDDFSRPLVSGSHLLYSVLASRVPGWAFLGDLFRNSFPYATAPWFDIGYMRCVSLRGFLEEFLALRVFLWEMTSGLSPYSALSLVRQRIHAVRQSTSLYGRISHFLVSGRRLHVVSVFSAELGSTADTWTALCR